MTNLGTKRQPAVFYDLLDGIALKAKLDPDEARRAALSICARAESLDDARDLLAMVGLLPEEVTQPAAPVEENTKPGPHQRTDDRIAALYAQGLPAGAIAERLGIQTRRVTLWRDRVQAEERGGRAPRWTTGAEGS